MGEGGALRLCPLRTVPAWSLEGERQLCWSAFCSGQASGSSPVQFVAPRASTVWNAFLVLILVVTMFHPPPPVCDVRTNSDLGVPDVAQQGMTGMMKSLSVVVMPTHLLPMHSAPTAPGTMSAYFEQIEVGGREIAPPHALSSAQGAHDRTYDLRRTTALVARDARP